MKQNKKGSCFIEFDSPKTEVIIQMGTLLELKFVNKEQLVKEEIYSIYYNNIRYL